VPDDQYTDEYEDYGNGYQEPAQQDSSTVKTLRQRGDALSRENRELKERLAALETEGRDSRIKSALEGAGISNFEKVAKLVPSDLPTDKVGEWLQEYGDVFGAKSAETETPLPAATAAVEQQMAAMQNLSTGASAPAGQLTEADLTAASSKEELFKMIGVPLPG
jgi:hypothetical protein